MTRFVNLAEMSLSLHATEPRTITCRYSVRADPIRVPLTTNRLLRSASSRNVFEELGTRRIRTRQLCGDQRHLQFQCTNFTVSHEVGVTCSIHEGHQIGALLQQANTKRCADAMPKTDLYSD